VKDAVNRAAIHVAAFSDDFCASIECSMDIQQRLFHDAGDLLDS